MHPFSILIGGATGVGKSTVAAGLARHFGIPRVLTTDVVREVLRGCVGRDTEPALHVSSFEAGGVEGFVAQAAAVAPGIAAVFRRAAVEGAGTILEGVHLVPGVTPLPEDLPDSGGGAAFVVPLVIVVDDVEIHQAYIRARGSADRPPERYLNRFDEIRRIQAELVRRAEEHAIAIIRSSTPERTVADAVAVVRSAVAAA